MAEEARDPNSTGKDLLARARADYDAAEQRERNNIKLAYEDLEFLAGENLSQWPVTQKTEREGEGRPVLQINQLPQFVHQITGDIRQMRPAIKVVPVDSQADEKIADMRAGLIRYIENRSDAQAIYFRAADSQVACGIGHWRVITEYADNSTFNQEIRIAPIEDGVAVLWDPDSNLPTKEDARYCFVPVDMSRAKFKQLYPKIVPTEFADAKWAHNSDWCTDDHVRVAEYWVKEPTKRLLALQKDGAIADITDADETKRAFYMSQGARIEERASTKVVRYLISASDVLEGPEEWPGRYIPVIPLIGEETRIGRKLIRSGIVRNAKDPQRMSNYFHSAHAETVALQPKAPFMVTETNVAKYQATWEQANRKNFPYIPYEPDAKNGGAAPGRVQPPVSSSGVLDGLSMAREDLRSVIGIYDASLGKQSNEISGRAILARQKEGDTGSFLYIDNFSRAVRQTGSIINDLIPHVYDAERTIRIMGEDGKIDVLEINKASGLRPESGETIFDHDITVGSYDVVAEMGPSYNTKQEEAREGMTAFVQAAPEAGSLILDLLAKAQNWPMSEDISKRLRAVLPPKIVTMESMEKQGASPEQIDQFLTQQQQQPDPKVMESQAAMQLKTQESQAALAMKGQELQAKQAYDEASIQLQAKKQQDDFALAQLKMQQDYELALTKLNAELELKTRECEARLHMDRETRDMKMQDVKEARETQKPSAVVQLGSDDAANGIAQALQGVAQLIAHSTETMAKASEAVVMAAQAMAAPREVTVKRNGDGTLQGQTRIMN